MSAPRVVPATAFFEAIARRYDRDFSLDRESSRESLARVLALLPPRARVLDLGVGTGRELGALQDAGHEVTGVDASQAMLEICARRARPVPLVACDLWGPLPFADASFDAAIALHGTLAHPPSDRDVTRLGSELARVLRRGGLMIAEVPSPGWLDELDRANARGDGAAAKRTGADRCVHVDRVSGLAVEARAWDEARWRELLSPALDARVRPVSPVEQLALARRVG